MDSDEEQLQMVAYEEPAAYAAASHSENRMGIKMTSKVPPQFDGQSSWFEYEDLIDDWLGITTWDADKHGTSLKNALIGSASFYKSMLDNALLRDPDRGLASQQAVRDFDSQVRLPLGRHASCTCGAQAKKAFPLSVHTPHISSKTKHRL